MILSSVGTVIARREYIHLDGGKVEAIVGKPELFPKGQGIDGFYYCPFQITGVEQDMVLFGSGADELEAILNAFKMLGARLGSRTSAVQNKLKWVCSETPGNLGDFD